MGNNNITYSRPVNGEIKEGETPVYRSALLKEGEPLTDCLFGEIKDLKTMYLNTFDNFKDNPFLGTREKTTEVVVDEETKEEKTVTVFGRYMYMTYEQVQNYAFGIARSIYNRDFSPKKDADGSQLRIFGIYGKNREEWALADIACIISNITSVPLYDTLGDSSIEYIITQTQMESLACSGDKVKKLCQLKKDGKIPSIKIIISFDPVTDVDEELCSGVDIKIFNLLKLAEEGQDLDVELEDPKVDDIYTICFTSGTTGDPKGVLSTHGNM
jgi:long-chain acyl-CoA synthetase